MKQTSFYALTSTYHIPRSITCDVISGMKKASRLYDAERMCTFHFILELHGNATSSSFLQKNRKNSIEYAKNFSENIFENLMEIFCSYCEGFVVERGSKLVKFVECHERFAYASWKNTNLSGKFCKEFCWGLYIFQLFRAQLGEFIEYFKIHKVEYH